MFSYDYITRKIKPMRVYELIKETFLRKAYIRIVHISWFATYGLMFLIPFPPGTWNWGAFLFGWSGCMLSLLLSAGIFGDDIASGRICVLIIKPLWPGELFIYRLMGLSLQALLHLLISGGIMFTLHSATGRGSINHLGLWILSSWLIFTTFAALSTSISVVVRRGQNSMLLFAAIAFVYLFVTLTVSLFPKHTATEVFMGLLRYVCPPVELLGNLAMGKYSVLKGVGCVIHSLTLTTVYSAVGIIILCKRQFVCVRD
jgi:ABC-type transport system involved in multi-copper enzyme maturation permease subunit